MKRDYQKPKMRVFKMPQTTTLLTMSDRSVGVKFSGGFTETDDWDEE